MIFVDTGFLFAMVSSKDEHHHRVLEVLSPYEDRRLSDFLLTTNRVVGETLTMTRNRKNARRVHAQHELWAGDATASRRRATGFSGGGCTMPLVARSRP